MFIVTKEGIHRTQASSIFVLQFSFSLMHESGRVAKKKKKRRRLGTVIICMMSGGDTRWTWGGGNNVLDFIIERSIARQGPIHSQDHEYST